VRGSHEGEPEDFQFKRKPLPLAEMRPSRQEEKQSSVSDVFSMNYAFDLLRSTKVRPGMKYLKISIGH
jgi:hypothetical protein